jgi:hypothetical protein
MVEALAAARPGTLRWTVPGRHGDGVERVEIVLALSERAESRGDDAA